MHLTHYLDDITVWAPAKVNLFLEVLGKRPDGYHDIATLMVAIRLYDTLIFRKANELTLTCSDQSLSVGSDNLVLKAARLLQQRTGCKQGASIRLIKRIPMAAGLAGGSTDAAATLAGLNQLWGLKLSNAELASMSGAIGSDIPFFFHAPAAWCTGRGEIVAPANLPIPLDFVLLCPSFGISTPAVYQNVTLPAQPITGEAIREALSKADVDSIAKLLHNRLEDAAAKVEPRIGDFAKMLADTKPAGSLMSGSGSTLFALCQSHEDATRVAAELAPQMKAHKFRVIITRTE
ncbi:MAG: 4-(cytidine 5'-diphospho)-2-C-methyl-D-erythritol kinase [Gemmataceae bacterium]|nr:4-(cytidine 5'-diphospho)-2-C-methyl-D-erythritol kinase [Gemmataceae bacterium]